MATTIQISDELRDELRRRKVFRNDTYEDIIWDSLEYMMDYTDEHQQEIEDARREVREGKYRTLDEVEKDLER